MAEVQLLYRTNFRVHGVRKIWRQLAREGIVVARLVRTMDLAGVVRGRRFRATIPDPAGACSLDRVNRQFKGTPAVKAAVVLPMGCQAAICLG